MMSKALALNGAKAVYIVGRRKDRLEAAAKESPHGNIIPLQGDVSSKESLQSVVDHIKQDMGYVNVLIANSGVPGPQHSNLTPESSLEEFQSTLWNTPFEEYTQTFAVNDAAVFFSVLAFLPLLHAGNEKHNVEQQSQVIATSSIGGFNRRVPGGFAYGQSKAAVTHMMKQLASNLVPYNIRANVLAPGRMSVYSSPNFFHLYSISVARSRSCRRPHAKRRLVYPSEMAAPIIGDGIFPKEKIPAERSGTEEDMAGCILYMTSRAGAYCNGNVIVTDGGRLSVMPATY